MNILTCFLVVNIRNYDICRRFKIPKPLGKRVKADDDPDHDPRQCKPQRKDYPLKTKLNVIKLRDVDQLSHGSNAKMYRWYTSQHYDRFKKELRGEVRESQETLIWTILARCKARRDKICYDTRLDYCAASLAAAVLEVITLYKQNIITTKHQEQNIIHFHSYYKNLFTKIKTKILDRNIT